jgi:dTDP-glucose 4,6-dehydratase
MRLLLTGGCGFIGHHIVEGLLKDTDWEIIVLDNINYAGALNKLLDISIWEKEKHRVKFIWHDLRAPISETIHNLIGEVDYVWHLAAESHVDNSLKDSIPFVMSNVLGTANLLEYLKKYHWNEDTCLKKIIYFSTDEVFGPAPENYFYKEGEVLNPSNPYSASKEGGEAISKAFAFCFGMPIMITRTMNVFGERQHPEKFIPKTIKALMNNKKIEIHGSVGNISSRCWIHARNVCNALLYLTEKGEIIEKKYQHVPDRGVYHIVGEEKNVMYLANRICMLIKERPLKTTEFELINFHYTRPGHDLRYALDGNKLKVCGFKYPLSLEDSFDKSIKWMIENKKWL